MKEQGYNLYKPYQRYDHQSHTPDIWRRPVDFYVTATSECKVLSENEFIITDVHSYYYAGGDVSHRGPDYTLRIKTYKPISNPTPSKVFNTPWEEYEEVI